MEILLDWRLDTTNYLKTTSSLILIKLVKDILNYKKKYDFNHAILYGFLLLNIISMAFMQAKIEKYLIEYIGILSLVFLILIIIYVNSYFKIQNILKKELSEKILNYNPLFMMGKINMFKDIQVCDYIKLEKVKKDEIRKFNYKKNVYNNSFEMHGFCYCKNDVCDSNKNVYLFKALRDYFHSQYCFIKIVNIQKIERVLSFYASIVAISMHSFILLFVNTIIVVVIEYVIFKRKKILNDNNEKCFKVLFDKLNTIINFQDGLFSVN